MPKNEFFINNIRVDAERCCIYRDGNAVPLEPKVAQVLVFLAQHPGAVVTHKTLLDAIWTNTVVEASALQRCIAQLRKAFGDDARQQRVIATYPKRGYSLIADVRWKQDTPAPLPRHWPRWLQPVAGVAVMLMIMSGLWLLSTPATTDDRNPGAMSMSTPADSGRTSMASQALTTAIADPDDFPVYSPDGRYVVYPRYLEDRKAHLWARDLAYGNDFLLTEEAGVYEHLSWSRDSSQLVFVDATCLVEHCPSRQCATLKSVAISQSETNILSVQKLIDCSPNRLLSPEWLNTNELAIIELNRNQAELVRYNIRTPAREVLYQSSEILPYHLSFSRQTFTLTIMAINSYGRKELLFLDTRTGTLNRNNSAVIVPDEDWYPSSSPL